MAWFCPYQLLSYIAWTITLIMVAFVWGRHSLAPGLRRVKKLAAEDREGYTGWGWDYDKGWYLTRPPRKITQDGVTYTEDKATIPIKLV